MNDWKADLGRFFEETRETREKQKVSEMDNFIVSVALPAFEQIRIELAKYGREVTVRSSGSSAALIVLRGGEEEMTYRIQGRTFPNGVLPYAEVRSRERKGLKLVRAESMFRSGAPDYSITDVTTDEIIRNFLSHYTRRVKPE